MLTTLVVMTLIVGIFTGVVGLWTTLWYLEGRAIKRLEKAHAKQVQEDSDARDEAVDLVNRYLGGTVLDYTGTQG